MTPLCTECGHELDRVDHYGIEHLILDGDVYRPANISEGVASEIDLRCGRCGASLQRDAREFFYRRWIAVLSVTARQDGT